MDNASRSILVFPRRGDRRGGPFRRGLFERRGHAFGANRHRRHAARYRRGRGLGRRGRNQLPVRQRRCSGSRLRARVRVQSCDGSTGVRTGAIVRHQRRLPSMLRPAVARSVRARLRPHRSVRRRARQRVRSVESLLRTLRDR